MLKATLPPHTLAKKHSCPPLPRFGPLTKENWDKLRGIWVEWEKCRVVGQRWIEGVCCAAKEAQAGLGGPSTDGIHLLGPQRPPCLPSWGPQQGVRVTASCSPDQYLVISSEMARWMGLSGGRSPDHQRRRLVSGTGPGGNEPLPGRRLLPLIAQRTTLQTETLQSRHSIAFASLPVSPLTLAHLLSPDNKHQHILSWRGQASLLQTALVLLIDFGPPNIHDHQSGPPKSLWIATNSTSKKCVDHDKITSYIPTYIHFSFFFF